MHLTGSRSSLNINVHLRNHIHDLQDMKEELHKKKSDFVVQQGLVFIQKSMD